MKNQKTNHKWRKKDLIFTLMIASVSLLGGILIGIQLQQMVFIAGMVEFGESLEGTNIEVNIDFNETILIEGFKETLVPIFNLTSEDLK